MSLPVQIITFLVVSGLALALTRPLARKFVERKKTATNADRSIGMIAKVTETINNESEVGAVYVDGKTWTARSTDDSVIPKDSKVVVEKMEGVKLFVKVKDMEETV